MKLDLAPCLAFFAACLGMSLALFSQPLLAQTVKNTPLPPKQGSLEESLELEPDLRKPLEFSEIWAYLMAGEEKEFSSDLPISDLAYFAAGLNNSGSLVSVPDRSKLGDFSGRVHLVVAEGSNFALSHFCLDPSLPIRKKLLAQIVEASRDFDGVQIDFEAVSREDTANFHSFLKELKAALGSRILSLAVPARTRKITDDIFDYTILSGLVDRIFVMAYDEHWSRSKPGPVASHDWSQKVGEYARATIAEEKLVLGLPFYGRAWQDESYSKAYRFSGIGRLLDEEKIPSIQKESGIPHFSYQKTVNVEVYFDNVHSTYKRLEIYHNQRIKNIGFWRLGQEDPLIWQTLLLKP